MMQHRTISFVLLSVSALILIGLSPSLVTTTTPVKDADRMRAAVALSASWMGIIYEEKERKGIIPSAARYFPSEALLGDEFTPLTTTLGSLDAKQISVNPQFAAVVVRWVTELGLDSTDVVMVASSGSFPGLAVSVLAALQVLNQRVVLLTSAGASSFGANQPEMTLLDMEHLLQQYGGLRFMPELVTYGCDNDNGEGFYEGGKEAVDSSARRNALTIRVPASLTEAVHERIALARHHRIRLLINIGGNHAMLGNCPHATLLPGGLNRTVPTCQHVERGAIVRIAESGVPVIHLLNIKDLGMQFGITDSHSSNERLYIGESPRPILSFIALFSLSGGVLLLFRKPRFSNRESQR